MHEKVVEISRHFLRIKNHKYRRYLICSKNFTHRISVIVGQRGVGKTTTLIQLLLEKVKGDRLSPQILYVQADHFALDQLSLYEIAEQFDQFGGKWLAIDEIHKYPNWSKELKSIYDTFPNLSLFVSGSSALEIYRGSHDLVRRAASYSMVGLSFREYLEIRTQTKFPSLSLQEICENHERLTEKLYEKMNDLSLKVLPIFQDYLETGYYPYFFELQDKKTYQITLEQNLHITIESDLAAIYPQLSGVSIQKIKQLLIYIANSAPFIPNWKKIMQALNIGDIRTLQGYFKNLEDARLIKLVSKASQKFSQLKSSDKIYLDNPNQFFAISSNNPDLGTIREIFFLNSVALEKQTRVAKSGDFVVNQEYLFEIGGKNKSYNQIKDKENAFLVCDGIEHGFKNKIPLWLFGFLY